VPTPAPSTPPAEAPRRGGRSAVVAGWMLSALVLLGLAAAAYAKREQVVQAWPASARVYNALGLSVRAAQ